MRPLTAVTHARLLRFPQEWYAEFSRENLSENDQGLERVLDSPASDPPPHHDAPQPEASAHSTPPAGDRPPQPVTPK